MNPFRQLQNALSAVSRGGRLDFFMERIKPDEREIILDVGGGAYPFSELKNSGRVIALNLDARLLSPLEKTGAMLVVGDGCELPFKDGAIAVVFSNAVIEHVGGTKRQRMFAAEISRAGKRYFVCTPNKGFPYEPHFHVPFFQFMPARVQRFLRASMGKEGLEVSLLGKKEMRELFPDAEIIGRTFGILPEVIIALRTDEH